MTRKLIYALLVVFFLSGCSGLRTQSDVLQEKLLAKLDSAQSLHDACMAQLNSKPDTIELHETVLIASEKSKNKLELMLSTKQINPKQRDLLITYTNESSQCRREFLADMLGHPFYEVYEVNYNELEMLLVKALKRQIDIGELNTMYVAHVQKLNTDYRRKAWEVVEYFHRMDQAELNSLKAASAVWNTQQQRGNQSFGYSSPFQNQVATPKVITCNKVGDQVVCNWF